MNVWEIAILKTIKSLGGEAELQEIYEKLPDFKQLTEKAKKIIPEYGEYPLYYHWVRRHITNLRRNDELKWISRGRYSLSEKGIKRIYIEKEKKTL